MKTIKKSISNIIEKLGYKIIKRRYVLIENVFKTKNRKKVLISYIVNPFVFGISYQHSNELECYTAARIFNKLGYQVDIVNYDETELIPEDLLKYDVIYGFGEPMEQSFYLNTTKKIQRIIYSTGCNTIYSNMVSSLRLRDFYQKHKILLAHSTRIAPCSWRLQTIFSDAIVVLGNSFVSDTFFQELTYVPIYNLNAFYFKKNSIDLNKKKFSESQKNFIWFGSTGAIHKGLDLLIDLFQDYPDIHLHICGIKEKSFISYYQNIIEKSKNITNHDFVNIESPLFTTLMLRCGAIVYPSVSEGGAVSVLNVLGNGGLIPIISKSCGLDLEKYGLIFSKIDIETIQRAINSYLNFSEVELQQMAFAVKEHLSREYSYRKYYRRLSYIIRDVLN